MIDIIWAPVVLRETPVTCVINYLVTCVVLIEKMYKPADAHTVVNFIIHLKLFFKFIQSHFSFSQFCTDNISKVFNPVCCFD